MLFWNINNIQATEEPTSLFTLQIIFNIRIKYQKRFIPQNYSSKSSCLFYYQPISAVHGTGNECIKAGYPAGAKIAQSPGCLRNIGMESETIATMSGEPTPTMRKPAGSTPCQCDETHWRCFTFNINAILEIRSVSIQYDFVTQTGYKMMNS